MIKPNIKNKSTGIYGHVDFVNEDGIGGWVLNLGKNEPSIVEVYINNKKIYEKATNLYRDDISNIINKPVNCGFFIKWEEMDLPSDFSYDDIKVVEKETGEEIIGVHRRNKRQGNFFIKSFRTINEKLKSVSSLSTKPAQMLRGKIKSDDNLEIYGHLDLVDERGIHGWFVNLDNPDDNELTIKIDGIEVGKVKPSFQREDINNILGKPIISGFFKSWNDLKLTENLFKKDLLEINVYYQNSPLDGKRFLKGKDLDKIKKICSISSKFKSIDEEDIKFYVDSLQKNNPQVSIVGWFWLSKKIDKFKFKILDKDNNEIKFNYKYGLPREDVFITKGLDYFHTGFVIETIFDKAGQYVFKIEISKDKEIKSYTLGYINVNQISHSKWLSKTCSSHLKLKTYSGQILGETKTFKDEILPENVDIIVPVFNGYNHLLRLFDSLIKNTNEPYKIIIIDDASTDYRVVEFLENLKESYPEKVILVRNKKNLGFTANINKGIKLSKNHIVILNTDTEVPPGWLYRLMKPIFEDEKIASTTPFTNAGTICSFPNFLEDNKLPEDIHTKFVDEIFSRFNIGNCLIELPTGIGFCMGMNRKAIEEVGNFDEKHFPKGYGEENDWCMRAKKKGYLNIMVPNLFVSHYHGGSFTPEEKHTFSTKNLDVVVSLHPEYLDLVHDFIGDDPPALIRNLAGILTFGKSKEVTLIIDHEIGGGTNIYRERLIKERLKEDKAVILYTENYFSTYGTVKFKYNNYEFTLKTKNFNDITKVFEECKINEIFLNNLVSFEKPFEILESIVEIKNITNSKLILPMHDYYCICPSYNLLNNEGIYCGVPKDIEKCNSCIKDNQYSEKPNIKDITLWRKKWNKIIDIADKIICFSKSSKEILLKAYPLIDESKILVLPHKLDVILRKVQINNSNGTIHVAVIGAINYQKGAKVILDLAKKIREKSLPIKIHIIGTLNRNPIGLEDIIHIYGSYKRDELPDIIEKLNINVVLFPSIWPETFSYVVEEIIEMDLPIIAFDIGAPAERLKEYDKAFLVKLGDLDKILKQLKNLNYLENKK